MGLTKRNVGAAALLTAGIFGTGVGTGAWTYRSHAATPSAAEQHVQGPVSLDEFECGSVGGQPDQQPSAVLVLQKERLTILRQILDQAKKRLQSKTGSVMDVTRAEVDVIRAEYDLCESDEEEVAVLKRWVAAAKRVEDMYDRLWKAASATQHEYLHAKLSRLEIEIELERAKARLAAAG